MDRIHIRELGARCIIGANDSERREAQDVVVSLVLYGDTHPAARSDRLTDAIDYRAVKKSVLALIEGSGFRLLEALAEAIATACLTFERVHAVKVSVDKPGALRFAKSVAVEITRKRGSP